MSVLVVTGATLVCPFASGTTTLNVTSQFKVTVEGKPAATIKDAAFGANIPPFPLCSCPSNPAVAAATAAAMGVLTPAACMGQFTGAWIPEQIQKTAGGSPCLTQGCSLVCTWGGQIKIANPGQTKVIL